MFPMVPYHALPQLHEEMKADCPPAYGGLWEAPGIARRFGLTTTNSLPQVFNRKVVAAQLDAEQSLSIVFAIPDHPWYLSGDMSAVRIAMTVGAAGKQEGQLLRVVDRRRRATQRGDDLQPPVHGLISANLSIGLDTDAAKPLRANSNLCRMGVKLGHPGSSFLPTKQTGSASPGFL